MSAHVLLNLLNESRNSDEMRGLPNGISPEYQLEQSISNFRCVGGILY